MTSQPDALFAIEPAHLPHYTHSAVIIGSVIILAIIILVAGVALAIAHHLVSAGPMTHREQSLRLHCVEKRETIGAYFELTEHAARSDLTVDVIPAPVSEVAGAWDKQKIGAPAELVLIPDSKPNGSPPSTTDCNSTPTTPNASQTTPSRRSGNDVRRSPRSRNNRQPGEAPDPFRP
jgi:hypothetical protein